MSETVDESIHRPVKQEHYKITSSETARKRGFIIIILFAVSNDAAGPIRFVSFIVNGSNLYGEWNSIMPKNEGDPVSNTGDGAGVDQLIEEPQRQRAGADTTTGASTGTGTGTETGTSTSTSTGTGKRKKKKGKKAVKRKRRKDRYESQNYLLRIEGTLCCASIIIGIIWLVTIIIALLVFLIWADFDISNTIDSVKDT
ncbi:hypothetical protein Y032_1004g3362 [Ancylostoma ceylanicum]|uniref:Uncharacterized protein n=1 Tax=Ancylostoma ceylanicum TaxID=53326 RepID=A0A016W7U8_9BILA|nr:hypothetical protein Y032_1004g3362 [Ancylostoma ceylanicum]